MNIYNLKECRNEKYEYDPYGEKLIKSLKKIKVICLITILSILALIIVSSINNDLLINKESYIYANLILIIVSYILLIMSAFKFEKMKLHESISPKALHDYYYYLYTKRKGESYKYNYLLMICKCNIQMYKYDEALMAIDLIEFDKLSNNKKHDFLMCKAIISRLTSYYENFEEDMFKYESFCKQNDKSERNIYIIRNESKDEIINLIDINGVSRGTRYAGRIIFYSVVFLIYVIMFKLRNMFLPNDIEYRSWLEVLCNIVKYISAVTILIFIKVFIEEYYENKKLGEIVYAASRIIVILYFFLGGFYMLKQCKEQVLETKVNDEVILVKQSKYSKEDKKYYCKPYTIFFRKPIAYEETQKDSKSKRSNKEVTKVEDNKESNNNYYSDNSLEDAFTKIYESEFKSSGDKMEFSTSAKGNLYAIIGSEKIKNIQGQAVKTTRRIVYDRESANGECYEFVYYEDQYSKDGTMVENTSILNFYAVVKSTGEVIKADKTEWGAGGSKAYRTATGE